MFQMCSATLILRPFRLVKETPYINRPNRMPYSLLEQQLTTVYTENKIIVVA